MWPLGFSRDFQESFEWLSGSGVLSREPCYCHLTQDPHVLCSHIRERQCLPTCQPVVSAARILDAGADAILRELAAKRGGEGRKITTREEVLQLADDLKSQPTGHLIGNSGARRRPRNIAVQLSSDRDG